MCTYTYTCILHSLFSTHTVVGITTLSRADHLTAQTREYECTRHVLPQVIARGTVLEYVMYLTLLGYCLCVCQFLHMLECSRYMGHPLA